MPENFDKLLQLLLKLINEKGYENILDTYALKYLSL